MTSVARTIADLGRKLPFEVALVPADGALFRKVVTPDALAAAVERGAHRPRNGAARRVVAFADGRAESPGETRSRVAIRRAGLPAPVLQHPVGGVTVRLRLGGAPDRRRVRREDQVRPVPAAGPGPRRRGVRGEGARGRVARPRAPGRALDLGGARLVRRPGRAACAGRSPADEAITASSQSARPRRRADRLCDECADLCEDDVDSGRAGRAPVGAEVPAVALGVADREVARAVVGVVQVDGHLRAGRPDAGAQRVGLVDDDVGAARARRRRPGARRRRARSRA